MHRPADRHPDIQQLPPFVPVYGSACVSAEPAELGGDALHDLAVACGVDEHRPVRVGVVVDEAGGDKHTLRIDDRLPTLSA